MGICKDTKRLDGKTVLITGGSTGIGKETALELAKRGAHVILACRNVKKATAAKTDIIEKSRNRNIFVIELDLASLASVRKCAATIVKNEPKLHILINNAGCGERGKKFTEDGLEIQMQTNHFGHFLLTNLLLGLLIQTAENEGENARIVVVSSEANEFPRNLSFIDDMHFSRDRTAGTLWAPFKIYGASKLCNILFTIELADQLEQHRKPVVVNSLHPGKVYTEFGRFSIFLKMLLKVIIFFLKTPKEGAQTTIYLAVADEVSNVTGKYFCDCKIAKPSKLAKEPGITKKLWELSERLVNLTPEEKYFKKSKLHIN